MHQLENPVFIFHYKLLNRFSQEKLEDICKSNLNNFPLCNIILLENPLLLKYSKNIFLPHYIDGFLINGIEVSVDMDESDFPLIL